MALLLLAGVMIWLTVYPLTFMQKLLRLKNAGDLSFKVILLGMAALHFFMAFVLEVTKEQRSWESRLLRCCPGQWKQFIIACLL